MSLDTKVLELNASVVEFALWSASGGSGILFGLLLLMLGVVSERFWDMSIIVLSCSRPVWNVMTDGSKFCIEQI